MTETPYTKQEELDVANNLQKCLGPEWLSHRNGPTGRLTYIEGKNAIILANEIFGFNGWSSEIKDTTVDFVEMTEQHKVNIGVSVTMRITLKDGTYHEDMGYGSSENARSKATAFEKAKKQAVTDATKRTLRNFGNAVGNCVYDKVYLNNIGKMANPQVKFLLKNLYRHDQFDAEKQLRNEKKQKQVAQEERHQLQLELQRQRAEVKVEPMSVLAGPISDNNINNNKAPIQTTTTTTASEAPTITVSNSIPNNPNIPTTTSNPYLLEPLVPEDSFSYEGDDEFFVQMLANDEFEEVLGLKVDEEEPVLRTPSQSSTASNTNNSPESSRVQRDPPLSDPQDVSRKRSRLSQS